MAAALAGLLDGRGRAPRTAGGHRRRGRPPADLAPHRAVPLHGYRLDRRRGRAAHRRGPRPGRLRARGGRVRARLPRLRVHPARCARPGRRGQRGSQQGRRPAAALRIRPSAAGLPPGPDRAEHRRLAPGRPRRLPPGARRRHRPGRRTAALLHLAAPRLARAARGGTRGGAARLRRVAADKGGAGLSRGYGSGAHLAGGRRAGTRGGRPAARGGRPAVQAAGRCAHLARPRLDPPPPGTAGAN